MPGGHFPGESLTQRSSPPRLPLTLTRGNSAPVVKVLLLLLCTALDFVQGKKQLYLHAFAYLQLVHKQHAQSQWHPSVGTAGSARGAVTGP